VLIMSAVRKVEPGNIHAKSQHVPQDDFAIRGRPDCGNDLGPAEHTCPRFRTQCKRACMVRWCMQCRNIARYEVELSLFQITSSQSERRTLRWRCAAPTLARFCELSTVLGTLSRGAHSRFPVCENAFQRASEFIALDSSNSFPRNARGNSMALNSAPISTISEIMYIHTSSAMPTPSDP